MNVIVTLNSGLGKDLGPNFSLTSDVGYVTSTGATLTELLAGKTVDVDYRSEIITVTSLGVCPSALELDMPCVSYQITESLGWGWDSNMACPAPTDIYYGNSSVFADATTISASSACTVTLGGYYSNGTIWKYSSDGRHLISSGTCMTGITTTTTSIGPTTTTTSTTPYAGSCIEYTFVPSEPTNSANCAWEDCQTGAYITEWWQVPYTRTVCARAGTAVIIDGDGWISEGLPCT